MEKAIVDTMIWVGNYSKNDQWATLSQEIILAFIDGKIKKVYVTNYVIVETINFLIRKENHEFAKRALAIFQTSRVEIRHGDPLFFSSIKKIFHQYPGLSLTDASLIALAQELNVPNIFSFDRVFDRVKGIRRLENFSE